MPVELYGWTWKEFAKLDRWTLASIELRMAFHEPFFKATGWLGRYPHLRNAIDLIWNEPRRARNAERNFEHDPRKHDVFIWNEWTELMIEGLCQWKEKTTLTGPHASWKTTSVAIYAICTWFASPLNTSVVLTSTTLKGLRKRIWKEAVKFYQLSQCGFGSLVPSEYAIRMSKGDDTAGVYGFATGQQEGEVKKAADNIIGYHNTFVLAICDEMQATNKAIVDAGISLRAGTTRYQFAGLGNADSELDEHGRMSEPVNGYDSISVDDETWETKLGGICIHLDGLESPRVRDGDSYYPGLLTNGDIELVRKENGEDSPEWWSKIRGFWPPQGITRTVLSNALIDQGKAREKAVWVGAYTEIAHLDPSFEGMDRCVLRFSKCGAIIDSEREVLELGSPIVIKVKASSPEPIHYQIVRQVKEECIKRNIPPERFALDASGEGGGLASIFVREWGAGILLVEFGGRPSADPISDANPKRADQEYDRKVTELHYRFRTTVILGQVRGLDSETATEFCQRRYEMKGNLISIETKTIMKKRTRRSPDFSDNAVIGAELARKLGLLGRASGEYGQRSQETWRSFAKKYDVVNHDYADV